MKSYLVAALLPVFLSFVAFPQIAPPRIKTGSNDLNKKKWRVVSESKYEVPLTVPWGEPPVQIFVKAGQLLSINTVGSMNFGCDDRCKVTADGASCDFSTRVEPKLICEGLIGKIGDDKAFNVGSNFSQIATNSGNLVLSVNDTKYEDNVGNWTATVQISEEETLCQLGNYPQPGDATNIIFFPQEQADWCWAAVAELLIKQASNAQIEQCDQVTKVGFDNKVNCCQSPIPKECITMGGNLAKSLKAYGFTFMLSAPINFWGLSESDVKLEIGGFNSPIAFEFQFSVGERTSEHYEVIYGYYYLNDEMYLRIWDPGDSSKRCEPLKSFPQPYGGRNIMIRSYLFRVRKS